jgi:hypothetical protein
MSESDSELRKFKKLIESLENKRVPENPTLFSCGLKAKRVHRKLVKEATRAINEGDALVTRVVDGEFGSGKTHLAHWVETDLYSHFGDDILVSYVDLKEAHDFPEVIEQILLTMKDRNNRHLVNILPTLLLDVTKSKMRISERIENTITEGRVNKQRICDYLTKQGFTQEASLKLSKCVVDRRGNVINAIGKDIKSFKALCRFLVSTKAKGICILLDEFESLDSKTNLVNMLEMLRCVHDAGNDFTSTYLIVLTVGAFWDKVRQLYLPLHQRWDGKKKLTLGFQSSIDAEELFTRLLEVYEKAGYLIRYRDLGRVDAAVKQIFEEIESDGEPRTFRVLLERCITRIKRRHWIS